MLLQAMLFQREYNEALNRTQQLFNMDEKKKLLEEHFSRKH